MIFDGHADIWTDVAIRRQKGISDVFKKVHLERFNKGEINGGIFVIWADPPYNNEPQKRVFEIIEHTAIEIMENRDIFKIIKKTKDFDTAISSGRMPIIIGIEGLSALGSNFNLLNLLYMFGVRHASLTWNEENKFATGVKGSSNRGLTEYGIQAVKKIEDLGIILDVSHLNEKSFWDVYRYSNKPFIASHSNCRSLCDVPRNLTDKQLKAIAEKGGLVGVNAFREFVHVEEDKQDIEHLADHIDHMVEVMGIDCVGFGFDFFDYLGDETKNSFAGSGNIGVKGIEDTTKAKNIIRIMEKRGYSKDDIEKISYKNFYRIINQILK
ncbi:dipeptidase [Alkaliphilus sp. B6464]|uniref:dipeptidase n=1 Tax=Alkaliphilus sp. B6464 TaxID=2731219 RepID=UPI001BA7AC59|nr:dipeptidase [Alkaliphilus sp. B6464]QUH19694.1 dipeptidase [Alkaliphilus sp. B6464]